METHVMHPGHPAERSKGAAADCCFRFRFSLTITASIFSTTPQELLHIYIHTSLIVGRPVIISRKWVETHVMHIQQKVRCCLPFHDRPLRQYSQQLHSTGAAYLPTSYRKTSNRVLVNQTANLFIVFITHTTSSVARVIIHCRTVVSCGNTYTGPSMTTK
jgi:hypothetical protein